MGESIKAPLGSARQDNLNIDNSKSFCLLYTSLWGDVFQDEYHGLPARNPRRDFQNFPLVQAAQACCKPDLLCAHLQSLSPTLPTISVFHRPAPGKRYYQTRSSQRIRIHNSTPCMSNQNFPLHLYFGSSAPTRMNLFIIFPSILPFLSNVQVLSVGSSADALVRDGTPPFREYIPLTQAFTRLLRSPLLTTLVFSKIACPRPLGECPYVENLSVLGPIDIEFLTLNRANPPIYKPQIKPQIKSLSCEASMKTIQHLFPYFCTEIIQSGEVDISALRQLVLSGERGHSSDLTENLINYVAGTLEDLDCGSVILPPKFKSMPHLRILKRRIILPTNGPPEQKLNQLRDVLTHSTTTSKVIERITINLLVVQMGFQELIHVTGPTLMMYSKPRRER